MAPAWLNALLRAAAVILGAALLGWLYGQFFLGAFIGAMAVLAGHLNMLFQLERALRTRSKIPVPDGTGIWAQVMARINYLKVRAKRHKRRYHRLMKEIRASTNAMPDAGIVLNEDYEITRYNVAAEHMLGLRHRRDRGQRVDNLIRDPAFVAYLRAGDLSQPVVIPSTMREDGWLSCRIVPYGAGQRLLLIRDITEQTRLARMRKEFVANASHELRSPLTVIGGYLEAMVGDEDTPEAWSRPVAEMQRQAGRMKDILDNLLELSRLETGAGASEDRIVDMRALLRESVEDGGASGGPRIGLRLESRARLYGEASELRSVITNLLSNAMRYTPPDGEVTVSWLSGPEGARLTVEDTGIGISQDDVPRVTERFFRVNRGRSRDDGGVGLGLAIVKHVLLRHDATLEIHSKPGSGSRFTCIFPPQRVVAADTVSLHPGGANETDQTAAR